MSWQTDTAIAPASLDNLGRFLATMEYRPSVRPNWEAGTWSQTIERWRGEGAPVDKIGDYWFDGIPMLGMDRREFIPFNCGMIPAFTHEVIARDEQTETFRDSRGIVRKALKNGMSMDTFISFPVTDMMSWQSLKYRYRYQGEERYSIDWRQQLPRWRDRRHPLIFGYNCSTPGFYWQAREWMGTENLSYAWYDQPDMMHDMMEFWADFLIEAGRPVLEQTSIEYICLSEDLSMKTGPLLSPETFATFIQPRLKRVIDFYKSHGTRYVCVDTDGNCEAVIPLFLDAGVDALWPLERAADQDPIRLRTKYGRSLRLWGGVDKRELAKDPAAIKGHLQTLLPLIEEGGFIPTVDHTVPPDVSWSNCQYYFELKARLLEGRL